MSADLLKYNPEIKNVECTPEGVADAVSQLGVASKDAKSALASCTANIQEQTAGRKVSSYEYLQSLQGSLTRDKVRLADTLWLKSVSSSLASQEAAVARKNFENDVKATTAMQQKMAMQEAAAAKERAANARVETANLDGSGANNYARAQNLGKALKQVFGGGEGKKM